MAARVDIGTLVSEINELHERYPTWTLDNAFVHWFLQAFLVPDAETAAQAVTGVSHDKGCDAVYIDESFGIVFVLQGKFHQGQKPPAEPRSDVIAFAQLGRIMTGPKDDFESYLSGIDPTVAKLLSEARQRIQRRNFELRLYYVTTGRCSAPLKSEAESEVAQANAVASLAVFDRNDVLTLLTDYLGGAAPPVPFLDLPIDARGIVGSDGVVQRYDSATGVESWILSMSGSDLAGLYSKGRDRVFARNIRGFLGDTAINDGMAQTLSKEPDNFWYFNNGVTLVCDSARKTAERGQAILRVTNPQIINGQQTTRVLSGAPFSQAKEAATLVRVISVPRHGDKGQGLAILAESGTEKPWDCPHCRDPKTPKSPIYGHIGHKAMKACGDYSGCIFEKGPTNILQTMEDPAFEGLPREFKAVESHCGQIEWPPKGWVLIATAGQDALTKTQCIRVRDRYIYAAQFHIEDEGTPESARAIMNNFLRLAKEWGGYNPDAKPVAEPKPLAKAKP